MGGGSLLSHWKTSGKSMSYLRYFLLLFCVCGSMVNAKGYAPAVAKNSTGFDIKFASNGTPLANMSNTASGVAVGATVALPLSSSVIIQAAATGAVTGAAAGGAWAAAAGALGGVALLGIPIIADWMQKQGVNATSSGFGLKDPLTCSTAPCSEYFDSNRAPSGAWHSSVSGACSARAAYATANDANYEYVAVNITATGCDLKTTGRAGTGYQGSISYQPFTPVTRDIAPSPANYVPATLAQAEAEMSAPSPTAAQVQALIDLNFPPVVTPPNVVGSPRAYLGNTVQMFSPDEKKIVDSWANLDYSQPGKVGVQIETKTTIEKAASTSTVTTVNADGTTSTSSVFSPAQSVTTTTLNNGATQTTAVTAPNGSVTATTGPAPDPAPVPCGLPNSPACKIDETGTKTDAGTTFDEPKTKIEEAKTAAQTAIDAARTITAPAWSFTFQLPTGCAPYVTGIKGVILNVCQFQSTIHGLLSAIWAAATVFAMIGMVGRTIRES